MFAKPTAAVTSASQFKRHDRTACAELRPRCTSASIALKRSPAAQGPAAGSITRRRPLTMTPYPPFTGSAACAALSSENACVPFAP